MYPDIFSFYTGGIEKAVGAAAIIAAVWLVVCLLSVACSVVMYVLHSLGLYTIALRRGIHRPWLSWVPLGDLWILGSISDQYQYVAKGKVRNRRKILLGLSIAMIALLVLIFAFAIMAAIASIGATFTEGAAIGSLLGVIVIYLVLMALVVLTAVFQYVAYYDLFRASNPGNASVFLVLSILFNFLLPIFVFCARKKDRGMPPRRNPAPQPAPEPEVNSVEVIDTEAVNTNVVEVQEEDFEE